MVDKSKKLFITGHKGMVGSTTLQLFKDNGYTNIVTATSNELDLRNQDAVLSFFNTHKPDYVLHIAAKVGGINANIENPGSFLYDNLMLETNVIEAARLHHIKKLLFLGSSCIYPKECKQPMKEEYMLTGPLEPTNEGYAIAKIAGLKLIETYHKQYNFNGITLIPSNIYGPNDSFDLKHAHVLSSLVKRFVDAKQNGQSNITLWGTGIAMHEFIHVQDIARAILFCFENYHNPEIINIGTGAEISIKDLALTIAQEVGFKGEILWDSSKPNGMLRKCMDVSKMKSIGFQPKISLHDGIKQVITTYSNTLNPTI